jgi:hypothetical protein
MKERVLTAGGYVSGTLGIRVPLNENPLHEKSVEKIKALTKKFIKNMEKNRKPLWGRFYTYIAIHVFFKPFVMKHQDRYEYVIKSWRKKGLIK